jgi:hypothetical protein
VLLTITTTRAPAERCIAALDPTTGAALLGFGAKLATEHV